MSSFYVENFGCRATQADGAAIEQQFRELGSSRAAAPAEADYIILNTCAVTAAAEQDARAAIRRIRRSNPDSRIVVTGCYAQRAPGEIAALAGVSHVIGNSHKHTLAQIALARASETKISQNREFIPVSDLARTTGASVETGARRPLSDRPPQTSGTGRARPRSETTTRGAIPVPAAQRPDIDAPFAFAQSDEVADQIMPSQAAQRRDRRARHGSAGKSTRDERVRFSGRHEPTRQSASAEIFVSDIFAHTELLAAPVFDSANERTRPNLKIQDGCNNRCSFCIIPSLRGRSRSLPIGGVLREVNQLVCAGYHELVLSGINLGRWGRDLNECQSGVPHVPPVGDMGTFHSSSAKFEDLIQTILTQTSIQKLRISSVEPMDWSDSLIQLVAESPRIAKHAHVPMQSGSDTILRRMHRKYRPWHYREKIERIRAAMPDAAIGADVMVGFPGETDSEFQETRSMIDDLPFTYLHVFTFSARPGTPAASMPNQVPVQIARERNRVLRHLAAEKKLAFMRTFIGRELQAITLNVSGDDARGPWTEALTDNYLKMRIRGKQEANQWLAAQVSGIQDGTLVAVVKESSRFASLGHPSAGQNVQLRCPGAAGIAIS